MKSFGTKQIAASGIMAALVCVTTLFIVFPIPATQGYFNVGDAMVMVAALTFGPIVGAFAGGVGAGLADVIAGYYNFAPFTFVIKGIEGLFAGWILSRIRKSEGIWHLATEVEAIVTGTTNPQETKTKVTELKNRVEEEFRARTRELILLAWLVGGLEMVTGYLVAEYFALGYGVFAFAEVPYNLVQMAVAGLVGIPISLALRRTRIGAA
jgi:uncharacterized membrane protein